jgi:multicomponent K+:H+ antiporter subunit E
MKRFGYRLLMPLFLWLMWLLLNGSGSAGQMALGLALSIALTCAAAPLRPLRAFPKRPLTMAKLFCIVSGDILRSNLAVARIIWLGPRAKATPGFVQIPLTLRDPHGLAALACIITYTPGTVWVDFSEQRKTMTLHVLDLKDESLWIRTVQQRYERPLMEIFE